MKHGHNYYSDIIRRRLMEKENIDFFDISHINQVNLIIYYGAHYCSILPEYMKTTKELIIEDTIKQLQVQLGTCI